MTAGGALGILCAMSIRVTPSSREDYFYLNGRSRERFPVVSGLPESSDSSSSGGAWLLPLAAISFPPVGRDQGNPWSASGLVGAYLDPEAELPAAPAVATEIYASDDAEYPIVDDGFSDGEDRTAWRTSNGTRSGDCSGRSVLEYAGKKAGGPFGHPLVAKAFRRPSGSPLLLEDSSSDGMKTWEEAHRTLLGFRRLAVYPLERPPKYRPDLSEESSDSSGDRFLPIADVSVEIEGLLDDAQGGKLRGEDVAWALEAFLERMRALDVRSLAYQGIHGTSSWSAWSAGYRPAWVPRFRGLPRAECPPPPGPSGESSDASEESREGVTLLHRRTVSGSYVTWDGVDGGCADDPHGLDGEWKTEALSESDEYGTPWLVPSFGSFAYSYGYGEEEHRTVGMRRVAADGAWSLAMVPDTDPASYTATSRTEGVVDWAGTAYFEIPSAAMRAALADGTVPASVTAVMSDPRVYCTCSVARRRTAKEGGSVRNVSNSARALVPVDATFRVVVDGGSAYVAADISVDAESVVRAAASSLPPADLSGLDAFDPVPTAWQELDPDDFPASARRCSSYYDVAAGRSVEKFAVLDVWGTVRVVAREEIYGTGQLALLVADWRFAADEA